MTTHDKPAARFDWLADHQTAGKHGSDEQDPRDERSPYERDRDRIVHSVAFRRLQGKTQLFPAQWADPMRTRLTHTLEVAQIGRGIARFVGVPGELVEAACLAHDLGHPPFGHVGEKLLNDLMLETGGFDSNAQSYRVVDELEDKKSDYPGLNLSRAVQLAMLKYPYQRSGLLADDNQPPPAAHLQRVGEEWVATRQFLYDGQRDFARWMFDGTGLDLLPVSRRIESPPRSLPCAIVDWADDIAYAIHDLEDGLLTGFLRPDRLTISETLEAVHRHLADAPVIWTAGQSPSQPVVYDHLHQLQIELQQTLETTKRGALRQVTRGYINDLILCAKVVVHGEGTSAFDYELVVPEDRRIRTAVLKALTFEFVLKDARVVRYMYKGRQILERLFEIFIDDPKIMDQARDQLFDYPMRRRLANASNDPVHRARMFADHLASMTEREAIALYQTMFDPNGGSPLI